MCIHFENMYSYMKIWKIWKYVFKYENEYNEYMTEIYVCTHLNIIYKYH